MAVDPLDPALARYHRQRLLPGIGDQGQRRLLDSSALVIGVGALGTVVAEHLCRAGVGRLTLVDRDIVELTNLQRQTLFDMDDVEQATPKAVAAKRRLSRINPDVAVTALVEHAGPRTLEATLDASGAAVIIDATDNFQTRYLLNDLAVKRGVPLVYGGAVGTSGMALTIRPGQTSCLRCLFPDPPAPGASPTCDTAGVLAPVTGVIAGFQAAEALKILLGRDDLCSPTLREVDLWTCRLRELDVTGARDPDCVCCGHRRFEHLDSGLGDLSLALCGTGSIQVTPAIADHGGTSRPRLDLPSLHARLSVHGDFRLTAHLLKGTLRESGLGLTVFPDARALVHGTADPSVARSAYDRYVGS